MCTPVAKVLLAGDAVSSALYVTAKTTQAVVNKLKPAKPPEIPAPAAATPPRPAPVSPPPIPTAQNPAYTSRLPNVAALRAANAGSANTLLTGPMGVSYTPNMLSRPTLLGS